VLVSLGQLTLSLCRQMGALVAAPWHQALAALAAVRDLQG
jgi:hypothetical protein